MRRIKIYSFLAALTLLISSCGPATSANAPDFVPTIIIEENPTASQNGLPRTEAEVPRVSLEETLTALQSGAAVIVDVRNVQAYQASHIAGAMSISLGEIEANPAGLNLDKDQWIITYCT
jgi:3-mercaptopyruvate sulfurtransferase SseA